MSIKSKIRSLLRTLGYDLSRVTDVQKRYPINNPLDVNGVEILADAEFQKSCAQVKGYSLLDTERLANLWMLCRETDPAGAMIEVGVYKGGGSLHLSNCCRQRKIIVCDPFSPDSFEKLDAKLDAIFSKEMFADHSESNVRNLLKDRPATILPGFFPTSVKGVALPKISFVHLDVDVYSATKESLLYFFSSGLLLPRSLIVLDDYNRRADGVNRAVAEVQAGTNAFVTLPIFPGQAVLIPKSF